MSIIIPDTGNCDAEILVTETHNPFNVEEEYGTLLTIIPFYDCNYIGNDEDGDFYSNVLEVYRSLRAAYQHDKERCISIEVRFKDQYCNS